MHHLFKGNDQTDDKVRYFLKKIFLIGCILASFVHSFLRRKPFRGVHTLSLSFLPLLPALLFLEECFWSDNAVTNTANARIPDTHTQTHTRAT